MGTDQVLPLRVRVDLGILTMKEYSTFPKDLGLEPHQQIVLSHFRTLVGGDVFLFAERQSAYSTTPAEWAEILIRIFHPFLNRSSRIIMNRSYNWNPMGHLDID